jgi:hypothetical protein
MRHANERAYQEALHNWQSATGKPEQHATYMPSLANALKEAIYQHNLSGTGREQRKLLMGAFNTQHWKALVWRELLADRWYETDQQLPEPPALPVLPDAPKSKKVEVQAEKVPFGSIAHEQGDREFMPIGAIETAHTTNGNGNGNH